MKCPKCGSELDTGFNCPNCGYKRYEVVVSKGVVKIYIETEMTELPNNCNECPYFVTTHIKTRIKDRYYETYCPFGNDYYKYEGHINAMGDYVEIDTCPLRIETEEVKE